VAVTVQRLNPFKRVTEKPVVFGRCIVDADSTKREVVYDVPDYFDGTLKIMAVAIADDAVASERERDTDSRAICNYTERAGARCAWRRIRKRRDRRQ